MNERRTKITDLLALLLFGLFAVCVLIVLLTGANSYRQLVSGGQARYDKRTAGQYIATRVRQAERLAVENFQGCEALVGTEEIDGEIYLTKVYCHDGYLRELFCAADADLLPEDGEKVLAAGNVSFSLEQGVLSVWIDGREMTLTLRADREVVP